MAQLQDLQSKLHILQADLAELTALQSTAKQPAVHTMLRDAIAAKTTEITTAETSLRDLTDPTPAPTPATPPPPPRPMTEESPVKQPTEPEGVSSYAPLARYSWDQSEKFVKIYCDLPGLSAAAGCDCSFTLTSFSFWATGVPGEGGKVQNYKLAVPQLCEKISMGGSSLLRKDNKFVIRIAKLQRGTEWSGLDDSEKKKQSEHQSLVGNGATTEELLQNMYKNADEKTRKELSQAAHTGRVKREEDARKNGVF